MSIKDAKAVPSVCPYCAVGCGTIVHTVEGQVVNIEGDPRSSINEGTLCPKGTAIYQLHVNPNRATQVLHRAPGATKWEVWDLERAMALDILNEWRLAQESLPFQDWLDRGAPSDDTQK